MAGPEREFRRVCVYCGSRFGIRPGFREAAAEVGRTLAEHGIGVVYGGAAVGLMGVVADAALAAGGEVIGVIDHSLLTKEIGHPSLTELRITESLSERKLVMADLSDGFIALPGGLGTLDELFEVLVSNQLHLHDKPIALLDVDHYWNLLLRFLDHAVAERLLSPVNRSLLLVSDDLSDLLGQMRAFELPASPKWLDR